jgi:hypothetical protein
MARNLFLALVFGLVGIAAVAVTGDPGHVEPGSVAAACSTTTADVSWSGVSDPHIYGYDVYYRLSGQSQDTKANANVVLGTGYAVSGLSWGVTYEFRVVAVYNDSHESEKSSPATCTTG